MLRFGGGASSSTITVGTAIFVLAVILLLFLLPRRHVIVPYILVSLFIPYSQVIVLSGIHFNVYRILLPFAWLRVLMGGSGDPENKFKLTGIDKALIAYVLTDAVCANLLWRDWSATVNRLGNIYNVLGIYFLLRFLIRDREDVERVIRTLAYACIFLAGFMILEHVTGRNVFSVFGGVPEFTVIREGKLRAQAVFAHAIVAGTVGANLLPLFIGQWWQGAKSKLLAGAAVIATGVMTITASSATPVGAAFAAMAALCLWRFRHKMKAFRWLLVTCVVSLHLVMKAPVWALIQRVSIFGGNSGYHRYELINQAILHFGDWFLVGTKNPSAWGYEMGDVSDAYVSAAVGGGLFTLLCYLAIFWQCFRYIGMARQAAEQVNDPKLEFQIWSFGAALMATLTAFIGITYFDQSIVVWYSLLAMIGAITTTTLARVPEAAGAAEDRLPPWMRGRVPLGASAPDVRQPVGTSAQLQPAGVAGDKTRLPWHYRRP